MRDFNPESILNLLKHADSKTLTQIMMSLGSDVPKSKILYHLKKLLEQGKIIRDGFKYRFYGEQHLDFIKIPCYGIAQAGPNARFNDDKVEYYVAVPPLFLHGCDPKDLFIMELAGDSMEPTLHEKNLILFKYYKNSLAVDNDIVLCKVHNEELKVKRFKNLGTYGLLCSDNYKKYPPITINEDTDHIIGKMVSVIY